ncbi:MAG: PEP-CTERM sorting domain-containing protein [Bryobacteraceae bacterium]
MNVSRALLSFAAVLVLALPAAQAGTVTFTVSDDLLTVPGGSDPIGLSGNPFSLMGTLDQGADGQTVFTPLTLSVTATSDLVGQTLTLDACGTTGAPSACSGAPAPTLTITGDSATLTFDVSVPVINQLAALSATVELPGAFMNNGSVSLANFTDVSIGSGSTLTYTTAIGLNGEVGISGTASMSGVTTTGPPPTVPEPTTIALLAGGLIGLVLKRRLSA